MSTSGIHHIRRYIVIRRMIIAIGLALLLLLPINQLFAHPEVMLNYFDAITLSGNSEVFIGWETASEPAVDGFYVERSLTATTSYTHVSAFIIAQGDAVTGAQYGFFDDTTELGRTYYYRLEVVNSDQTLEYHGPISVTAGVPANSLIPRAYLPLIVHTIKTPGYQSARNGINTTLRLSCFRSRSSCSLCFASTLCRSFWRARLDQGL